MELPEGYVDPIYPDKIFRLLQAHYWRKQASNMWSTKHDAFVMSHGFDSIDPDTCLYL